MHNKRPEKPNIQVDAKPDILIDVIVGSSVQMTPFERYPTMLGTMSTPSMATRQAPVKK